MESVMVLKYFMKTSATSLSSVTISFFSSKIIFLACLIDLFEKKGPSVFHSQKTTLINSFFFSQFNYCPLVWMFCSKEANNEIEKLHKRALQIIHDDFFSRS